MKKIPLTKGFEAIVDDDDYERISALKWYAEKGYSKWYAGRCEYIGRIDGKNIVKRLHMHRFILGDVPNNLIVDHINGDGLDNRKENLRICTKQENGRNRAKHKGNTKNRFKGVYRYKNDSRYTVLIVVDKGKQILVGKFKDEIEAAHAYNAAAIKYHGEYAYLNPI